MKTVLFAMLALGAAMPCGAKAAENAKAPAASWQAQLKDVIVVPSGADALKAFEELRAKNGARVLVPRSALPPGGLLVPPSLRFKEVSGLTLIDAVAAARKLNVAWSRDGATAVLYSPASDATVERLRREMASANGAVRGEALGVASWMSDPRIVSMLVSAAKAADTNSAAAHIDRLTNVGWDVVMALDDSSRDLLPLLEQYATNRTVQFRWRIEQAILQMSDNSIVERIENVLAGQDRAKRSWAVDALRHLDPDKAIALIDKYPTLMTERTWDAFGLLQKMDGDRVVRMIEKCPGLLADNGLRMRTYPLLARLGTDKAMAILEQGTHSDMFGRTLSLKALAQVGTDRALQLMANAMTNRDDESSTHLAPLEIVRALAEGNARGDKAMALIELAMTNAEGAAGFNMRLENVLPAAGRVGGERAGRFVIGALTHADPQVRAAAAAAMGRIGGEKALALLEKAGSDTNAEVRAAAAAGLVEVGGDRAWALLGKVAADHDESVRKAAAAARSALVEALGKVGGDQAPAILEKAVADQDAGVRKSAAAVLGQIGGEKSLALLGRIIADPDVAVRRTVAQALCLTDVPGARDVMVAQLEAEQDPEALNSVAEPFFKRFTGDWKLEKALHEAQERLRK